MQSAALGRITDQCRWRKTIQALLFETAPKHRHCEPLSGGVAIHLAQKDQKQSKRFFLKKEAKTSILKASGGNASLPALSMPCSNPIIIPEQLERSCATHPIQILKIATL
jgi:hypothetical protein